MTAPIDQARLRELADRLMGPHEWGYRCPVEGGFIEDNAPFDFASELLDALSAERERGDRAVGLLRTMLPEYPRDPINGTSPTFYQCEAGRDFLATQKAEGA